MLRTQQSAARRLRFACCLLGSALFSLPLFADQPASHNVSAERLEMLTQAAQAQVDKGKLAGIATLVYQDGKVIHRKQHGYQDVENKVPLSEDTLYKIFSLTKPVTGTAMLMLYEEGKFQLDDPVEKYLPELKGLKVAKEEGPNGQPITEPADHPVTIRELMTHTAGFTYGFFSESQVDDLYKQANIFDRESTLAETVDKLSKIPLRQQPGTEWHYSVSVDVQARLVEVLSGMSFDTFLKERIFVPLGMNDTDFYVPQDKAERLAVSYQPEEEGGLVPLPNTQHFTKPKMLNGGGGLISSMDDYLRFARMLLNGGELDGVRLLKPETVQAMRSNQLPEGVDAISPIYPGNQFGLNVAVVTDADEAVLPEGTFWWWGVQGPWAWIDPANGIITLGMMQNTDYRHSIGVHRAIAKILYGDEI
ncbi:serine hydrolase domain-containing protein [Pseudomonas profundi]|uniref:serine hydrolase domain-containing protein n=1 Tax=Pseudomonas profundi TaxID=1981513 RepID=UPI00123C074A|nr:serine hydrolase domain-containing protein [Pseudomonas profundi]